MQTSTSKSPVSVNPPRPGSESTSHGIRVVVQPAYSALDSDPGNNYYKFLYRIRITNLSECTAQLLARHWIIVDADGERQEVQGEGVVGQKPVLKPGESFEYASFCPLGTPWGTMEGFYRMRRINGAEGSDAVPEQFDVRIGRFFLVCPPEERTDDL